MNRSYSKIRHIQESNLRLEKRILSEQLGPDRLSSRKGDMTKKQSEFFNKYYKLNLPLDGDWTNLEFNNTMERYLKEKKLPIWVCKKGDNFCHDDDEGQITTTQWDELQRSIEMDNNKLQTGGNVNTTHDKSYDYKLEDGKYYYSLKGQNKWTEAKGNGLLSIKTKVKF
jgi:hypothetical protein